MTEVVDADSLDAERAPAGGPSDPVVFDVLDARGSRSFGPVPLLLLPGTMADYDLWADVMAMLADVASPRVSRIDLDDSVAGMADSILAAAPGRFALAGHSQGGVVCLEMVRRAPQRVIRLALLNVSARPPDDSLFTRWGRMRRRIEGGEFGDVIKEFAKENLRTAEADAPLRARLEEMASRVGRDGVLRQLDAQISRPDSRPALGAIACPTLVISGGDDQVCPPELQEEVASAIPGARLELVAHCGHMSPLEKPDRVSALMRTWLAQVAA